MPTWRRPLLALYVTALLVFLADQLTKLYIVSVLGTVEGSFRRLVDDLLWIRMVHNTGAAFGMLPNASILFGLAAIAVTVGILFYSRQLSNATVIVRVALGMELGGALGNLLDRVRLGYVVDFVDVRLWPRLWPYVFNVADASITVGVILLAARIFLSRGADSVPVVDKPTSDERAV